MDCNIPMLTSELLTVFSQCSGGYVFFGDLTTSFYRWSNNAVSALGLESDYFKNTSMWQDIMHPDDYAGFSQSFDNLSGEESFHVSNDFRIKTRDKKYVWMRCNGWCITPNGYTGYVFVGVMSDSSSQSTLDPVTGLPCNYDFRIALSKIAEQSIPHAIVIIGIDDFKGINDLYSYSFGDKVLTSFTQELAGTLPLSVPLFRLDGDGFAFFLPTVDEAEILRCFEELQVLAQTPTVIDGAAISFTVSAGVSLYPESGTDGEELYRDARMALRTAKLKGKNRLVIYSKKILADEQFKLRILSILRECVNSDFQGFSLAYQPLVNASDRSLHGCEVLLRWEHPDFPEGVSPLAFIPVLEESGLILRVGKWVIEHALVQCTIWQKLIPDFHMSINICSRQFEDPDFKFYILDTIHAHGIRPEKITLELTESLEVLDPVEMKKVFDFIRSQGIKIAFDDFGTGYASLGIFRVLSADELKIDRSFLERIAYDVTDLKIIANIINLCHSINMRVCVEGIETPEIEAIIRQLGPELLQGYLYSRPLSAENFEQLYFLQQPDKGAEHIPKPLSPFDYSMAYDHARPTQSMSIEGIANNAHAGVLQTRLDKDYTLISCSEGYRRMLGYTAVEMTELFQNKSVNFIHPHDLNRVNEELHRQFCLGDTATVELRLVCSDGTPIWVVGSCSLVKNPLGDFCLIIVILDNDRNKKRSLEIAAAYEAYELLFKNNLLAESQLKNFSSQTIDPLTGLLNKGFSENRICHVMANTPTALDFSLLLIDIDNFKSVNEKIGHVKGDAILKSMADVLCSTFSPDAVLARSGGNEFLVFLTNKSLDLVSQLAAQLIPTLQIEYECEDFVDKISASIGVASCRNGENNFYELYQRATAALVRAKKHGKAGYAIAPN